LLKWVVARSLRHCGVVVALACLVAVYGVHVASGVKIDVFPEFAPPRIVIQTEAPGLSAEEVEAVVTRPVEYGLNGTPELEAIYSESIQGLSVVTTVFREDADIYRVRQLTGERLAAITGQLPEVVKAPRMGQLTSSTSLTLALGLVSDERTPMELRTFPDWTVRLRLLGAPGVARVEVFGGCCPARVSRAAWPHTNPCTRHSSSPGPSRDRSRTGEQPSSTLLVGATS
jgi:Cu/Ag efflux pump CusA